MPDTFLLRLLPPLDAAADGLGLLDGDVLAGGDGVQGILQVGVGFYHLQNGNWRGATGVLRNGIERLREFEPETLGVDVRRLVRESERCLEELEELGRERVRDFDTSKLPNVEWVS